MRTRPEVKKTAWKSPRLKPILDFALIQRPKGCSSLRFVHEKIAEASSHGHTKARHSFCAWTTSGTRSELFLQSCRLDIALETGAEKKDECKNYKQLGAAEENHIHDPAVPALLSWLESSFP